ncbi:choice-of-anchor J domain-containing protein [Bacteroides rodentium]|jgi:hypothetical protein|uniref:choice-of-anchor J domain-containing protein n=1 Tax=Bacteroides rodentium TaxID=691816 RepID=UPI000AD39D1F|nr:choice-of-anchor J domain-containing protein [Bacteroides rodentium]
MKKNILTSFALLALLAACNDDYNDKFDINVGYEDVKNVAMTLSSSDYATIAGNASNLEIALAKDPEGNTGVEALEAVGKDKYFTAEASAEDYIPAFLAAKYPNADLKSKFTVTYNQYQAPSNYLKDFTSVSSYALESEDYEGIWGDKVKASFLSPTTLGKIPAILKEKVSSAEVGDMVVVDYAYSETEPSIGGGGNTPAEPTWTQVEMIPTRSAGVSWDFVNMGPIDLSAYKGQTISIGFKYTSTDAGAATWELKNAKVLSVPYLDVCLYAKDDAGDFIKVAKKSAFNGAGEYVIVAQGADGQFYPFGRLADGKNYGYMYPKPIVVSDSKIAASDAVDFVVTLEATEAGFNIKNVLGQYFYMSGNYDSFNVTTEVGEEGYDWTVTSAGGSDLFTITNVLKEKSVKLNYYNGSYSFGSYAASKVEGFTYYNNSLCGDMGGFTIYDVNIGGLDRIWQNTDAYGFKASAFVNKVNYASESFIVSPAIEIAENAALPYVTIDEAFRFGKAEELTVWVSTDYVASAATKVLAMTRATVSANRSDLYRFDGENWAAYASDAAKVAVVEPAVYASIGASSISEPEQVLPLYLNEKYPYAIEAERAAVVYKKSADAFAVKEFTKMSGAWMVTPEFVQQVTTFNKDVDGITAKISVYIDDPLTGGSDGGFTAQDVILGGGMSYIWTLDNTYGWKGGAYANSKCNASESWLVSPAFDFRKGVAPVMSFEEAVNKLGVGYTVADHTFVMISTDYKDDVTKATWKEIQLANRPAGTDWNFVESGVIDLSEYVGNIVRIAFKYTSTEESAPTWEFKNILIKEQDAE